MFRQLNHKYLTWEKEKSFSQLFCETPHEAEREPVPPCVRFQGFLHLSNGGRSRSRSLRHRCCHPGRGHHRHAGKLPSYICVLQVPLFCAVVDTYFCELSLSTVSITNVARVFVRPCRSRGLRTPSNIFIINLAVTDFLMCLTQAPVFFINSMHKRWIFGKKGNARLTTLS